MITKELVALWIVLFAAPIFMVCIKHIAIDWHAEAWLRRSMFRDILPFLIVSTLLLLIAVVLLII